MSRTRLPSTVHTSNYPRVLSRGQKNAQKLAEKLEQLYFKKRRYVFQVLKQFFLFPEGSSSSVLSLDKYDKLVFDDIIIHTLVRKLETKLLQCKLWAFLNIKMLRILQNTNTLTTKISRVVQIKRYQYKEYSFERILWYSSSNALPHKKVGSGTKLDSKSLLSSPSKLKRFQQTIKKSSKITTYSQKNIIYPDSITTVFNGPSSSQFSKVKLQNQQINNTPLHEYRDSSKDSSGRRRVIRVQRSRSPASNYYNVDQVRRQYRNLNRADTRNQSNKNQNRCQKVYCACSRSRSKSAIDREKSKIQRLKQKKTHENGQRQRNDLRSPRQQPLTDKNIPLSPRAPRGNYMSHLQIKEQVVRPSYSYEYTQVKTVEVRRC